MKQPVHKRQGQKRTAFGDYKTVCGLTLPQRTRTLWRLVTCNDCWGRNRP